MNDDLLAKLKRLLAVTPDHQLIVEPISRRTLTATIIEISTLRKRVAELEAQLANAGSNNHIHVEVLTMTHARDQHHLVFHYADGVADILGLSTAQQLAIRTAMHLALREQAVGYEAMAADLATQVELLRNELQAAVDASNEEPMQRLRRELAAAADQMETTESENSAISALLANVKTSPAPVTISANGTHPAPAVLAAVQAAHAITQEVFNAAAAQEAAATEAQEAALAEPQPDPTPATAAENRRSANYKWPTLDDVPLEIVKELNAKRRQWQSVTAGDKRIIVLALIGELGQDLPPGETLSIETFNRHRPRWMPTFPSLSTALGMTWKQMLAAAPQL